MTNDLESLPIGQESPRLVNAVVEVPVTSRIKYEYDPELGRMVLDRVLPGSVRYPADYGFIPSTRAEDGDPVDIIVAAFEPVFSGCIVRARTIGALNMSDQSGPDYKIYAVPEDDPRFADIKTLDDLPEQSLNEVVQFFEIYKELEGDGQVEIHGWDSLETAQEAIRQYAL